MATPSTLNRILIILCLLAIPCVQLFGVRKVFHCDCSGTDVAMLQDRCFGVDGEDCHPEEHGVHSEHSEGESHHHAETHDNFRTSVFSLKPVALPAPVVVDALRLEIPIFRAATPGELLMPLETFSDPPPDPNPARHSILLI